MPVRFGAVASEPRRCVRFRVAARLHRLLPAAGCAAPADQTLERRSYADPLCDWVTNMPGTLHLLEALINFYHPCWVVIVTPDKVYENREWEYDYREYERVGAHDILKR